MCLIEKHSDKDRGLGIVRERGREGVKERERRMDMEISEMYMIIGGLL